MHGIDVSMSRKFVTHRVISLALAAATLLVSGLGVASNDVKIAFIGDQNKGSSPEAILSLVASENTDLVLLQGDPGYTNNNAADWENDINYALGSDFPILAVRGMHENSEWPEYQRLIQERIDRVSGLACSGDTGVKAKCSFGNVDVVQVAPSISGEAVEIAEDKYAEFIRSSFAGTDNRWRICSWQKPRAIEQGSTETEPSSWSVYDACLDAGAMIAMAHTDTYQRTHLLNSYPSRQVVDHNNDMPLLPGQSFAFLSRSDARFIQGGSTDTDYFASIYAAEQPDQVVAAGALFCSFSQSTASCYFKTIDGSVHDQFTLALGGTSGGVVSEMALADPTSEPFDLSDDASNKVRNTTLVQFNQTLSSKRPTFKIEYLPEGWRGDVLWDGKDVGDSALYPNNEIESKIDLPTDGGTYNVRLTLWEDGNSQNTLVAKNGLVTATTGSAAAAATAPPPTVPNTPAPVQVAVQPQTTESNANDAAAALSQGLDENLPMMGLFYGHPAALAKSPGNTPKKARHFIRFRATRSQVIDEAEFFVRIGPGYSSGTGGAIKYALFSDDGSSNHYPNLNDRYGESESMFVPGDFNLDKGYTKRLKMVGTRALVAGRLYHLGIINLDTSSGTIPTDGSVIPPRTDTRYDSWDRSAQGPWFSQGAAWAVSDNGNGYGPFRQIDGSRDIQPWFAVKYADGTWEGTFYTNSDYPRNEPYDTSRGKASDVRREVAWIDGQFAASQPFTVSQKDRIVDGLWTHFGHHKSGGTPNGSPLKAELLDSSGTVLASVEYQTDRQLYETTLPKNAPGIKSLDYRLRMASDWKYKAFSADRSSHVVLKSGSSYSVRYTSAAGGNYMMLATPSFSFTNSDLATRNRNSFQDGDAARRSEDGGRTFPKEVDWGERGWGGKFGMLFTIKGQVSHARDFVAPQ